jgi:pimeloyl-ACP methyl ester carboxylesterase
VQDIVVPKAGHWLMEEAPAATIAAVQDFLAPQTSILIR